MNRTRLTLETIRQLIPLGICDDDVHKLSEIPIALAYEVTNIAKEAQSVQEFIDRQSSNSFCKKAAGSISMAGSQHSADRSGFLMHQASLDAAPQDVVPKLLHAKVLHVSYYPVLSGHERQRRMYDTLVATSIGSPHGEGSFQNHQQLGNMPQNARTQEKAGTPQAILCQRPLGTPRYGPTGLAAENAEWKSYSINQ